VPATVGGSSALALGFGILLLIFTGAASATVPMFAMMTMFASLHFFSWASGGSRVVPENIPIHLLTGSTLLGLFYLAADPTSTPRSFIGKVYAGVALGLVEVIIRLFTPLSEGIFISVVLVQALSMIFDQYLAPPKDESRDTVFGDMTPSSLGRF
jgi:Na+-translocating ferredoxin:NAD+ oxidoreductase RnfD subunit